MRYNSKEKNDNSITIKLNYNNEVYNIPILLTKSCSQLREDIFNKFNIDNSYILSYKNIMITKDDLSPVSILFKNDKNPLMFINDNNTILPSIKKNSSITINSNIPQQKLLNILNSFFQSKYIPFDASIKNPIKGVYNIKFSNPNISSEFLNYFNKKVFRNNKNSKKFLTINTNRSLNYKRNNSKISFDNKILPSIRGKTNSNMSSKSDIVIKNDKNIALYKVIKEVYKSDLISERSISSGIDKYHQSSMNTIAQSNNVNKKRNKSEYINDKYNDEVYEGMYNFPFMSQEEKYYREKFLDKKNWLNKDGFIVSVGKYKMKYNFIPNYVNASPSESPLIYKYRDVNKKKWINKNGFIL